MEFANSEKSQLLQIQPSHVAVLVHSVERTAKFLARYGFDIGPAENWEGEGTREIYVGPKMANSLLLMEPVKPGAYQRAMDKRGPGLHHLAIDVLNLEDFLISISDSGWLLHPASVRTMKATQTAYLARPGFPALIEVQERKEIVERSLFVTKIELSIPQELSAMRSAIGLGEIIVPTASKSVIQCGSVTIPLQELCNVY